MIIKGMPARSISGNYSKQTTKKEGKARGKRDGGGLFKRKTGKNRHPYYNQRVSNRVEKNQRRQ
jgi:hypothetical protein